MGSLLVKVMVSLAWPLPARMPCLAFGLALALRKRPGQS
jgi:hypothetical protein